MLRRILVCTIACGAVSAISLAITSPRLAPSTASTHGTMAHVAQLRSAWLPQRATGISMMSDEEVGIYYRTLGISEDAEYDEIMDAYMELTERYADDAGKLGLYEEAKEKVLDDRLQKRMSGTLKAKVADSPFDAKPVERIPPWVIAGEFLRKFLAVPSKQFAIKVVTLIGGLSAACWISPNIAGTALLINVVSTVGFIYNKGESEVPRDDFGQIGEIRPTKFKPMAATMAVTAVPWLWGFTTAKRLISIGAVPRWVPELVLRTSLISMGCMVAALFVRTQAIFD